MLGKTKSHWTNWASAALLFCGAIAGPARAVSLQWDPNQEPDLAGYRVHVVHVAAASTNIVEAGLTNSAAVNGLAPGQAYRFFVTAYNVDGIESDPSNEVSFTEPFPNISPVIEPIPAITVEEGQEVAFKAFASDLDLPAQALSFTLGAGAPVGAVIDPESGAFAWTPSAGQGPATNVLAITVSDSGSPVMSATQWVTIIVRKPAPRVTSYSLRIGSFASGAVAISPKVELASTGAKYPAGTRVTLTAAPQSGATFKGWTVNGASLAANPLVINMQANTVASPIFEMAGRPANPADAISLKMTHTSGEFALLIGGEMGAWTLDGSTDLVNWVEVGSGLTSERLPVESNRGLAFYRVRPRPLAAFDENP